MNIFSSVNLLEVVESTRVYSFSVPVGASYEEAEKILQVFVDTLKDMKEKAAQAAAEQPAQPVEAELVKP